MSTLLLGRTYCAWCHVIAVSTSASILSLVFKARAKRRYWKHTSQKKMVAFLKALCSINLLSSSLQLQLRCKRCTGFGLRNACSTGYGQLQVAFPTEVLQYFRLLFFFHTEVRTPVSVGDWALIVHGLKCSSQIKN